MGNVKGSDKLPDTLTPFSQTQEQEEIKLPWGRLYSYVEKFKSVDLVDESISLGRAEDCTITVCSENFPANTMLNISKLHFTIRKDFHEQLIYLEDHSKNGTFINETLVGKGKKHILQHDDIISIGSKGSQKLFSFKLLESNEKNQYLPHELNKRYILSRFLGKGACGEVHLLLEKTSIKAFAVKKIKKGIYSSENIHHLDHPLKIMNEVKILRSLSHPYIIQMKEIVETKTDVFLILEYMGGGELTKRILSIRPMSEQNIKLIFYQIALGVQYLHENDITHRDLKPDNVLLASDEAETIVKITDFGLSKILTDYMMMETICGTPTYVAPEIIDGTYSAYSKKVDIWSLGVILYYMISKELPFRSPDRAVLNKLIIRGKFRMDSPNWLGVSKLAKDLLKRMLVVNPQNRFDICEVLRHPWLSKDALMQYKVSNLMKNEEVDDYFEESTCDSIEPLSKRSRIESTL